LNGQIAIESNGTKNTRRYKDFCDSFFWLFVFFVAAPSHLKRNGEVLAEDFAWSAIAESLAGPVVE